MSAAKFRVERASVPIEPLSPVVRAVSYPPDCTIWVPDVMDGIVHYNMGARKPKERGRRWTRKIVLRPEQGQNTEASRHGGKKHNRVATFFFFQGEVLRIAMVNSNDPQCRFRDHGPRSVLSLHNDDLVTRMTVMADNILTRGIPSLDGTVVVVTWNQLRQMERFRHVAVVPNLTITWPSA
ncbi:MAG: hypothetical protein AAB473_00465 [Patescibacteria group bacterium]